MENDKTDYDDSPVKYIERLKSMINHTDGDDIADLMPQHCASVYELQSDLIDYVIEKFILCTGKDVFTVSAWPVAMTLEEPPISDLDSLHPGLLALEFFRGSEARPAPSDERVPKSSLPPVVLPIGRLLKGYTTESGISDSDATAYVLVVDAITPGHPVWLIWDRLAGHEPELDYVHPDKHDPVFGGVGKNFDAAQILPSIKDWLESYGNLDLSQLEESIKATGLVGFVKAKEATLGYVTELLGETESQPATDAMHGDEMSDARFAEIRAALGSPFQGKNFCPLSPYEYIRKLEEATARDNSLDQYLRKACSIDDTPPRQSFLEWLQKLAIIDFANVEDICAHRHHLNFNKVEPFNLVANGEDDFIVGTWPRDLRYEETDGEVHAALLSLETSALEAGKSLPKLILPVGELMNNKANRLETGYILVIDAVAPGHPVWLIYDRNQVDDLGEEQIVVDPTRRPLIFKGIDPNFDAAQIFPSVQDWIQSYGKVDFAQLEESIKATCITGAVQAKEILLSEAQELFRQ
ncbi:uncharacterized protein FFB14_08610 [Fusarium fujikuroi]|nr:uncharacterized protein FFB14_08610 [Fusarium fujikuroi]